MTEELLSKIFAITGFVAAALTIIAIITAVIVILVSGLKKARQKDSPGGEIITEEEIRELLLKLFPLAVKIIAGVFPAGKETTSNEK